ncbi:MAG: hypothetical protein WCF57_20120 [Pyrinomonadaceae bacterium]
MTLALILAFVLLIVGLSCFVFLYDYHKLVARARRIKAIREARLNQEAGR